ncbi:hypothetical protein OIU76_023887 [Salix suchowensis]|nr:hypothetical protein OIU76_023887 [Salix suchowensis]
MHFSSMLPQSPYLEKMINRIWRLLACYEGLE